MLSGNVPVFADVDMRTFTVTADTVGAVLTAETAAILPVDLFGNPAPYIELRKLGLPVIEDACQALGSSYMGKQAGALGDIAAISFYPSKNLAGFGDGEPCSHRTRLWPTKCAFCAITAPRTRSLTRWSATQAGWMSCRRQHCESHSPNSRCTSSNANVRVVLTEERFLLRR